MTEAGAMKEGISRKKDIKSGKGEGKQLISESLQKRE
jgi:hypothetical protein